MFETSHSPLAASALDWLAAGIRAAHPERVVREAVRVETSDADGSGTLVVDDTRYPLDEYGEIVVLGGGKAAAGVARALEAVLGDRLDGGVVVTNAPEPCERVRVLPGGHPTPTADGVESTSALLDRAADLDDDALVLAVVTGGGSACMTAPADGLTLADLQATTEALLDSGATIAEINAVRKHCSGLKGGRLAAAVAPARTVALVFSDVVGNDLATIASGPFAPDETTYADALAVLDRHAIDVPPAVRDHLERGAAGERPETPTAGDPAFDRVASHVLADGMTAMRGAAAAASEDGFSSLLLSSRVRGEAREAAKTHVAVAEEAVATGNPVEPPAVVVSGGETTVTVRGDGEGGANQEFALAAALELDADVVGDRVVVASVDTDGTDGPTDAAGAVVDARTVEGRAERERARDALADNDAYGALDAADALLKPGPTGTNVNDLRVVVVGGDDG